MANSNLGTKRFILFIVSYYSQSSREVRVGPQGKNLEAGPKAEFMEGCCLQLGGGGTHL